MRQLVQAVTQAYNISTPLASLLAVFGVAMCGNGWTVDLHDLAKHNVIEHDGSLVHDDACAGCSFAPTSVDRSLLERILSISPNAFLTFQDLAKARALRDVETRQPLNRLHAEIARGELALIFEVLGVCAPPDEIRRRKGGCTHDAEMTVPKKYMEQWFVEERLPDGWQRPIKVVGLIEIFTKSRKIARMVLDLQKAPLH